MKTIKIRQGAFHRRTGTRWHPAVVVSIIIGGTTLFVFAIYLFQQGLLPHSPNGVKIRSLDSALEITVSAIAAQFICACGDCGEKSLDVCICPDADKEREAIRHHLRAGQRPDQVIATIDDTYGGLKSEFRIK